MPLDDVDHSLLEGIRRGEESAWEAFIARFEGRLTAFVRTRIVNAASAEDIVQETFAGFLVSLPNYDRSTALDTFLYSIASHKLTDFLRHKGRRPAVPLQPADEPEGNREPVGPSRKASSLARSRERTDAEQEMIVDCLSDLIRQWKSRGEFERLQVAELLFVLGWANKDVANRLDLSEQTVANHKQYVLTKLKESARAAGLRDFDLSQVGVKPDA